jgi:hypothetical protein
MRIVAKLSELILMRLFEKTYGDYPACRAIVFNSFKAVAIYVQWMMNRLIDGDMSGVLTCFEF